MNKVCSNCYYRITPIHHSGNMGCKYDLRDVDPQHTCPSWKQEFTPKRGTKHGTKSTKNKSK